MRRWWLGIGAGLVACQPAPGSPPTSSTPVDCPAYSGPDVGAWRQVAYPPGALRYPTATDGAALLVLGGSDCLLCQLSELEAGQSEWQTRDFPDPLPSAQSVDSLIATPNFVVAVGIRTPESDLSVYGQVAVLDRASQAWTLHRLPDDFPIRYEVEVHWTGTEVLLWGGYDSNRNLLDPNWMVDPDWQVNVHSDGLLFDPVGGTFRRTAPALSPVTSGTGEGDPRYYLASVWTPEGLVVWGVHPGEVGSLLARYAPEQDEWSRLETTSSPPRRQGHQLVHDEGSVYLYSGIATRVGADGDAPEPRCTDGLGSSCWDMWRLDLAALEWEEVDVPTFVDLNITTGGPRRTASFAGGRFMSGGHVCPGVAIYDPALDLWTRSTLDGAPVAPISVLSLGSELYLSGARESAELPGDAVWIFDPEG